MKQKDDPTTYLALILSILAFGISFFSIGELIGRKTTKHRVNRQWREKCVRIGVAEYSKKTGKWQLKPEFRRKMGD